MLPLCLNMLLRGTFLRLDCSHPDPCCIWISHAMLPYMGTRDVMHMVVAESFAFWLTQSTLWGVGCSSSLMCKLGQQRYDVNACRRGAHIWKGRQTYLMFCMWVPPALSSIAVDCWAETFSHYLTSGMSGMVSVLHAVCLCAHNHLTTRWLWSEYFL